MGRRIHLPENVPGHYFVFVFVFVFGEATPLQAVIQCLFGMTSH
jgi:hypothetical protein